MPNYGLNENLQDNGDGSPRLGSRALYDEWPPSSPTLQDNMLFSILPLFYTQQKKAMWS